MDLGVTLAILGAVCAVALSGIGSAIGVRLGGQTANGVMTVNPENFVNFMLLTALPGTQGIYGFVLGFMVMLKIGLLGGNLVSVTQYQGWAILFASLPVALCGLFSALYQGYVCSAGIEMLARQPKELVKPLMMAVLVEFYAILGFTASFLLVNGINLGA